ncbi:hybrid sensor histidine kinase/response regulator [uncultured Mailhella sp.]|uniref:hybrid sensor histidine kinase/response regulator n=1 Tax=uncultured Mailhella sp. TaxID=1981031 RepID=UPI00262C24E6|nr:hybrid sensor histidine kinase/response regulator [uncultured Mailhella sp.]
MLSRLLVGRVGKRLFFSVLLLVCISAFGGLVGTYVRAFNRQFTEESSMRLAEVSDTIVAHLTTVISDTQTMLRIASQAVSSIGTPEARLEYLSEIADQFGFVYLGYAGRDGMLHATVPSESRSVAGTDSFQAALRGESTVSDQIRKIFTYHAASGILITVPLELDGERGALTAMLETRKLREGLKLESFGKESRSYIINPKGTVIMRARSMDLGNLFIAMSNVTFAGGSIESFIDSILHRQRGLSSYIDLAQHRQFIYYQPLSFNNWTAITIVPESAVLSARAIDMTRELAFVGTGLVLLFMGITFWALRAYRQSQESRIAMDAKSAFLANMSHEIRTPMNVVVGLSEIMLREDMPSEQRERLVSILNAGKGLLTIIDDILDLTKIESGKFAIIDEPYALETVLNDVTTIAAMRIGHKPVLFCTELDPALPRGLVGDMGRVKQVLINIVGNAVKFTERGSVRLIVGGERRGGNWQLCMEVRDTGIGIRSEDLDKLFISFNQVDTRRNSKIKGTGLGLAISRKLCEMMGGTISVSSVYGQGSSFVMTFPQGIDDKTPLLAPLPEGVSLLLCEASETMRAVEAEALQRAGAVCEFCETPEQFSERLQSGSFTHALAPRAVLRGLEEPEGVRFIGLLGIQDGALLGMEGTNVYQPLFALQLPRALDFDGEAPAVRAGLGKEVREPLPFVSILIVDDNEINVEVAEGLMAVYGMRMDHAFSGAEALKAVQEHDYDLVFMDHMMPDMDGVETTQRIRALPDAKYRDLPIVALTANVTLEMRRLFFANGFSGFLAKPIETSALDRLLRTWLKDINDRRAAEEKAKGVQPAGDTAAQACSPERPEARDGEASDSVTPCLVASAEGESVPAAVDSHGGART